MSHITTHNNLLSTFHLWRINRKRGFEISHGDDICHSDKPHGLQISKTNIQFSALWQSPYPTATGLELTYLLY